jgi:hypothetical protein
MYEGEADRDRLLSAGGTDSRADDIERGIPSQHSEQYPLYPPTSYGPPHMDPAEAVPFTWAEVSENHFDHRHEPYVYGQVN